MYRFIGADGKEYGPVDAAQILTWLREGRVDARTMARREDSPGAEWGRLGDFVEFGVITPAPFSVTAAIESSGPNVAALIGFILAIFSAVPCCCCCFNSILAIPALIISWAGLSSANKRPDRRGHGLAVAGIILSLLGLAFLGLGIIWWVISATLDTGANSFRFHF